MTKPEIHIDGCGCRYKNLLTTGKYCISFIETINIPKDIPFLIRIYIYHYSVVISKTGIAKLDFLRTVSRIGCEGL